MRRIEEKDYIINDQITLVLSSNESSDVLDYVVKMHKYHNKIDSISPVLNVNEFDKNDDSTYWLIKYKDNKIGFLNLIYREQSIDNTLEIHRFFIDAEARKDGIGSEVIKFLKKQAKHYGYRGITAKVYCNNPAIMFYEKNSFKTYYRYMFLDAEND